MSSFEPHNNFDNFRNLFRLFEEDKQVCAPDFVEGPHQGFQHCNTYSLFSYIGVATPAEPRGEKKMFLVQILAGEKL